MDKSKDSGNWLKFFKDAGIPTKTGASYAHIFVENRIHKDMLSDLTVDHLRLMGITLIGDVIAILRHAKSVHQDSLRKVVILKSKDDPPESSSSSSSSRSSSSSSSSSSSDSEQDVEMVEITKPATKKLISKAHESKVKKESSTHSEESRRQIRSKVINNTPATSNKSNAGSEGKSLTQSLKRKHYENEQAMEVDPPVKKAVVKTTNTSTNTGRSILHRVQENRPQVKKSVSTDSQVIGPKLPPPKKTVFDRLGAETSSPQVSSTTEPKPEIETRFTRTIGNVNMSMEPVKIVANIDIPPPKSSSVFNRLGDVTPEPMSALPYAGVLKSPPTTIKRSPMNMTKKVVTMRADEPEVPVKLRAAAKPTIHQNIKLRVGETSFKPKPKPKLTRASLTNGKFTNLASEGIFANPNNALQLSAKDRLGLQNKKTTLNKSAKARLGLQTNSGKTLSSRPMAQRLTRPLGVKRQFGEDSFKFSSRDEALGSKKVSFGGVDRRLIPPIRSNRGGRNMKSGVHSRLGPGRFS